MTRGTFVLFMPEDIYLTTEFNGGMYLEGYGEEAAKLIRTISTPEELLEMIKKFNARHHKYPEEEIVVYREERYSTAEMMDMSKNYMKKYFSDYLFIKNCTGKPLIVTGEEIVSGFKMEYKLPNNESGVLWFGNETYDFPPELNAFRTEEEIQKRKMISDEYGLDEIDAAWFVNQHLKDDIFDVFCNIREFAALEAEDTGLLFKANERYFNFDLYIKDIEDAMKNDDEAYNDLVLLPSGKVAIITKH